ncbi:long-chain fatty acid transport protein 6-like [Diadema antillarum]|uniref:long-chain fatty acid transport protein 6-like n=1 Tax=Diadema antillarum TaxID=105358 RepID=UPI003A87B4C7
MPQSPGIARPAALVAASAVPASYFWLRWRYPQFWKDVKFLSHLAKLKSTLRHDLSSDITVVDLFERHTQANPSHPCILFEKQAYSYGDVQTNANRVARWVTTADPNLRKGDAVCILMQNSPVLVWTWLGFLKKGIITSMLNFNLKSTALLHCIKVSEAKKLVFGTEFLGLVQELLPELRALNIELWMVNDFQVYGVAPPVGVVPMDLSTMSGEPFPSEPMRLEETAAYIFTSGTTGLPKPATVPHRKIIRGVAMHFFSELTPDDVYYVTLPLYHSAGLVLGLSSMWYYGATVALAKKFSASHFWDDIRRHNVTGFQYIGELCRYLLAQPRRMDDGKYPQRLKVACGNGLRPEIWEEFQKRFNIDKIIEVYAATEGNFGFINFEGKVGSIGRYPWIMRKLLDNIELVEYDYASGEPRRGKNGFCVPVPMGQTGLALFKVDKENPFTGYKGLRKMNERKIERGVKVKGDVYFNTGDLLRMDEEDYVYFMDRVGDTFRWKGENVSTMEVSQVLSSFPAIMEANVYGVQIPGKDGRAGMAAIVPHEGMKVNMRDLYAHVTSQLPDYACPKFLRVMAQLEITGTFKHKKTELVKQGFDMHSIDDELFVIDPVEKAYTPLTSRHIQAIMSGQSKL